MNQIMIFKFQYTFYKISSEFYDFKMQFTFGTVVRRIAECLSAANVNNTAS